MIMADYCVQADVEQIYGVSNVEIWADLDNNKFPTDITARIVAMITQAREYIDSKLKNGPYDISTFDATEPTMNRANALLAGVYLYENRGINDFDPESGRSVHRLQWQKTEVEKTIKSILKGAVRLKLPAAVVTAMFTLPEVEAD